MYRTILFDLDGTLIDSAPDIAHSVNHVRRHYGEPPLTLEQVKQAVGSGLDALLRDTVPAPLADARRVYLEHHTEHCLDDTRLYPGVREGLQQLAEVATLAVVTNKDQALTERVLRGLGLEDVLTAAIGGDTAAGRKPSPRPLVAILEAVGAGPWDALMVGDGLGDVQAAHAAGAAACAIAWGYRPLELLLQAAPEHTARTFAELVELVRHAPRTVFEAVGEETFWRLARAFYGRVDRDQRIRAMFPRSLEGPIERQALFFVQFFGGPQEYSRRRGHPRLRMRHAPFAVDRAARDAWVENMLAAVDEVGIPEPARGVFVRYVQHTGTFLINTEPPAPR